MTMRKAVVGNVKIVFCCFFSLLIGFWGEFRIALGEGEMISEESADPSALQQQQKVLNQMAKINERFMREG
jgi:hypothetical protein